MKLKIHRGTKQIGGNIVEIATGTTRIILDCGRNLPPLDDPKAADGIEIDGLTRGEIAYDAVFITHYHADHCGLIERVNADIPVYASRETKSVLDVIADFTDRPLPRINKILEHGRVERVGDITVLPLSVYHSAKGAMMLLVEADGQKLLYTGDFSRIDEAYYPMIGKVDVMLCEGTNIGARGGYTEQDVEHEAAKIMLETDGQVFVLCSTTNIERVRRIERACRKSGRTIAIDPFMKAILDRVGTALFVEPVGFVPHYISAENSPRVHKYLISDIQSFTNAEAVSKMTNLTFMVRQTMGDFLKRLDKLAPLAGSTLIYSMWRGYENTAGTKHFLDTCRSLGMRIEYIHASGHTYREQLEAAVLRLEPRRLIPIHTESADMFRELYDFVTLLDDGDVFDCGAGYKDIKNLRQLYSLIACRGSLGKYAGFEDSVREMSDEHIRGALETANIRDLTTAFHGLHYSVVQRIAENLPENKQAEVCEDWNNTPFVSKIDIETGVDRVRGLLMKGKG